MAVRKAPMQPAIVPANCAAVRLGEDDGGEAAVSKLKLNVFPPIV